MKLVKLWNVEMVLKVKSIALANISSITLQEAPLK